MEKMTRQILFRYNEATEEKLLDLRDKLGGLYPTKSQVIRSAIHRLWNEKIKKEERKNDLL